MYWIVSYIWENMSYILNPLGRGTKNVNLTLNLCLETTAHIILQTPALLLYFSASFTGSDITHFVILWLSSSCSSLWFLIMVIWGEPNSEHWELHCVRFHTLTDYHYVNTQVLQCVIYLKDQTNWWRCFRLSFRYQRVSIS